MNAYLTITRIEGEPSKLLDGYRRNSAKMSSVGRDHGLILHAAAATADGLMVVNLWPSRDGSESASRDPRRAEVVEREELAGRIRPEHFEVESYELFDGAGG